MSNRPNLGLNVSCSKFSNMKKRSLFILVSLGALLMTQCTDPSNNGNADQESLEAEMATGFQLLQSNCFNCHNPEAELDDRVAPPMFAVKSHYADLSEEDFKKAMVDFLKAPAVEATRMPGAVKRFGLMPIMGFDDAEIEAVATYLYHTKLEAPDWYAQHFEAEQQKYKNSAKQHPNYLAEGKQLALSTKAVLGKNLLGAIKTQGSAGALEFCNTRAIHLTDSMSTVLGASIRRVSDQARNPNNKANLSEMEYIVRSKQLLSAGQSIAGTIQKIDGKMVGYYPIITNDMCMQCHGSPEQINPETQNKINALYPQDKAFGYTPNQLRGIWVVSME